MSGDDYPSGEREMPEALWPMHVEVYVEGQGHRVYWQRARSCRGFPGSRALDDVVARALCDYDETHDDHWYNLDTDTVAALIADAVNKRHAPVVIAPGVFCLTCDEPWPCAAASRETPT